MHKDFEIFKASEAMLDERLPKNSLSVIRLDGSNFSTLTKQFEKPFSKSFEEAMNHAAAAVLNEVFPNALVTYVASDEISLVISDAHVELPYGGRIQKLVSLASSVAGIAFLRHIPTMVGSPHFDGRMLLLQDSSDIREYITWRRLDCRKNATSMAAGSLHSHRELLGVSTRERGELLVGTDFEKIPESTFNGRFVTTERRTHFFSTASRDLTEVVTASAKKIHDAALVRRLSN